MKQRLEGQFDVLEPHRPISYMSAAAEGTTDDLSSLPSHVMEENSADCNK